MEEALRRGAPEALLGLAVFASACLALGLACLAVAPSQEAARPIPAPFAGSPR